MGKKVICILYITLMTQVLYGLGSEHMGKVRSQNDWPDGLVDLANDSNRVHAFFVNWEDYFFYSGDTQALNKFLQAYSKLEGTVLEVILHPGKKKAKSPWDEKPRDIWVDWRLFASPDIESRIKKAKEKAGTEVKFLAKLDVWLGGRVELDSLVIPLNVEVKSGQEIEKFIANHKDKQKRNNRSLKENKGTKK